MAPKYEVETLPENIVGTSLPVQVKIFPATAFHTLDWVGIYPLLTPTAPGLSLARWTYLGQGKKTIKDKETQCFPIYVIELFLLFSYIFLYKDKEK